MNIRTLCLGILSFQEASGYEIKKLAEDGMFSHFIDASYGSIYPALTRMLEDGLVTVRAQQQSGRPGKKVYAITADGRQALSQALNVDPSRDKFKSEFLFQVLLMEHFPLWRLAEVYQRQLEELTGELERVRVCPASASAHTGQRFVNGYGQAVLAAAVAYLEEQKPLILRHAGDAANQAAE